MASKTIRAVLYARVSTTNHDQRPEAQIGELRRYCKARDWQIAHEIIDHGYSGSTDNRPGLRQLQVLVRSREVDAILVIKLDRLFRSLKHLITSMEEFQALSVLFVATKDNVDYSTPAGRFFVQVLGSLAEFEKDLLRERTIMGLEHARSIGKRLGRPITVNPNTIVMLRSQGLTHRQIHERLGVSKGAIWRALMLAPKTSRKRHTEKSKKSRGGDVD